MKSPLYSFVVPVRNGEATLAQTLESIRKQTFKDFELIVVDNGSEDQTAKVAKSFDCYYILEKKVGRSRARNTGVASAKGQYLVFIDADVILRKTWLGEVDRALKHLPVDGLATKIVPFHEDASLLNRFRFFYGAFRTHGTFLNLHRSDGGVFPLVNTAAAVFLKNSFEAVGGFDETLVRHEDLDLSLKLFCSGYVLGGTRYAQSQVSFVADGKRPFEDLISYLERSFEVNRHSLWPLSWKKPLSFDVILEILKTPRHWDLFPLAVGVELASVLGRIARPASAARPKTTVLGPNALRFSFSAEKSSFMLRKNLNFIFLDKEVYLLDGPFRCRPLASRISSLILQLLNGKKLAPSAFPVLLKTGFFKPLGA